MTLKFHLTNTSGRPIKLVNCLRGPMWVAARGTRGSTVTVELDQWVFASQGSFRKIMAPFVASGLKITIETDLECIGLGEDVRTGEPKAPEVQVVPPVVESPAPQSVLRPIHEGIPRVTTLGQIDLSGDEMVQLGKTGGRGDRAFVSGVLRTPMEDGMPQKIKRIPGAKGGITPEPPRESRPEVPAHVTKGLDVIVDPAQAVRTANELRARVQLQAENEAEADAKAENEAEAGDVEDPVVDVAVDEKPAEVAAPVVPPKQPKPRRGRKPKAPKAPKGAEVGINMPKGGSKRSTVSV